MAETARDLLLQKILEWARSRSDIRALALVGSSARIEHRADAWADLDVVLVTSDPRRYLSTPEWFAEIGDPWVCTVERNSAGEITERRVVFRDGVAADFILVPAAGAREVIADAPLADIVGRGMEVLLDRDAVFSSLPVSAPAERMVTQPEYLDVVNDFWFHAVWTAKKLRRGEIWVAKSCCDVYMKALLLHMMEWHAKALSGWEADTWYGGRFLEQWAPPDVVDELQEVFARYGEDDVWRALIASTTLFRRIAQETAELLAYVYPTGVDEGVTEWVNRCYSGQLNVE